MTLAQPAPVQNLTADVLKARFKELRAQTNDVYQNWQIRVHRAWFWLKRAEAFGQDQQEAAFLFLWIAFNSLYGCWDAEKDTPQTDGHARDRFLERICRWDAPLIEQTLRQHRGLVKRLLENPFLSNVFWRDPTNPKAKGWATEDANHLDSHLKNRESFVLLKQVTLRLFVFRGQLVHGASTGGSSLNRSTLKYCRCMLQILVPLLLHIVIEHGANDDWPELCYPPQK